MIFSDDTSCRPDHYIIMDMNIDINKNVNKGVNDDITKGAAFVASKTFAESLDFLRVFLRIIVLFLFVSIYFKNVAYASNIIWDPNIDNEGYGPGYSRVSTPGENESESENADTEESDISNAKGTSEASETQDTNADYDTKAQEYSLTLKNTAIPSSLANIVFINGRAIDLLRPVIALTYDDGPMDSVGNQIMNVLASYGAKCTFFLVGDRISRMASEVQRMVAEGHEVANHTYSHKYLNKLSAAEIIEQVTACNNVIEQIAGIRPALMRLPGGNKNQTVLSNINMPIILWNIDTRDWETRNAQSTINAVLGKVKSGDIVLMHELYQSSADATTVIVPTLIGQGFQLVTVSEMAALRGITLSPNAVYYSM